MNFKTQLKTRTLKTTKPLITWFFTDWNANDYRRQNNLYGGIGYYRVIAPARTLKDNFEIEVVGEEFQHWGTTDETYTRLGRDSDLIITKLISDELTASNILGTAKHFKRKVLVDVDDNYLNMNVENPAFAEYAEGNKVRYTVSTMMKLADGLIVSTEPLKKLYKSLNKNIDVLPNCVELAEWPTERKRKNDGKIRIGFAGGIAHKADLEMILEPMSYLLVKYPNLIFEICGAVAPENAMRMAVTMNEFCKRDISTQFRIGAGTEGGQWQGYPELLNSFGWDIIIAPLVDNEFNRCKSHIRWLEAAMVGCPVVASPVYPYCEAIEGRQTIRDGVTGMLAAKKIDWFDKLSFLIENETERQLLAQNAYDYIKKEWTYESWKPKWKKVLNKYL